MRAVQYVKTGALAVILVCTFTPGTDTQTPYGWRGRIVTGVTRRPVY